MSCSPADVSPHGLALGPVSQIKRTGLISLRSADERAGDPENPAMLSLPVAFVQGEKGKRGGFRVDYSNLLAGINWASDRAARDGVERLNDDDDVARPCLSTHACFVSFQHLSHLCLRTSLTPPLLRHLVQNPQKTGADAAD